MKMRIGLILFVNLLSHCILLAQNRKPAIQKEPAWVTMTSINYNRSQLDHEADGGYINLAYEKQVNLQQQSVYRKTIIKLLSESGVQERSEVNVSFDPSYSQLIFHSIKIVRGKETINKLIPAKIKVVQQENELNRYLYNGALSVILFLEDVRKGDIIEYSYTIKGFNPVFNGRFAGIFDANFSEPVYHLYYKLVVPGNRTVQIKNSSTDVAYRTSKSGNETIYEWKFKDVPGVRVQDQTPSWHDPYAMIMISECSSWSEVVDWARTLFPFNSKLSSALRKKVDELSAGKTTEARVQTALRFVQDEVRYMGIEMGVQSHKPNHPDKILGQRFGDCKDKSYLLCTILRAMGIEASPVMINTSYKKSIMNWLPAPTAFDHVTVRVFCNGRYYFFDPTIPFQRGPIDSIAYPDYQCGLVITDTTTMLTTIPLQEKGMVKVREEFDIRDMSGDARLMVRTEFTGSFADDTRDQFNSNSRTEIKERFRNFYSSSFKKIEADSLSFTDDEQSGKIIVNEYYTIHELWESDKGVAKSYYSPYIINSVIKRPKDTRRKMPISIEYPARYKEEIIINVPEEWRGDESVENIDCAAFKLSARFSYGYKKFLLKYEYESIKDHVSSKESEEFFSSLDAVEDRLSYMLSDNVNADITDESGNVRQRGNLYATITLGLLSFIGVVIWQKQRKRR